MKLSDLHTGERGVIVKVTGHGGFRKRIVEMGFVKGQLVEVLLNAPLQDPVKYKIMGYEVSLRRSEASLIEIVTEEEAKQFQHKDSPTLRDEVITASDIQLQSVPEKKRKTRKGALVGSRACGQLQRSYRRCEGRNL